MATIQDRYKKFIEELSNFAPSGDYEKDFRYFQERAKQEIQPKVTITTPSQRLERTLEVCKEKNWKCLDPFLKENSTIYNFQCEKGHIWKESQYKIVHNGTGCPECLQDKRRNEILEKVLDHCEKNNGILLKDEYIRADKGDFYYECEKGHQWNETWIQTKRRKEFCPECMKIKKFQIQK